MDAPRSSRATLTPAQRRRRFALVCVGALVVVNLVLVAAVKSNSGRHTSAQAVPARTDATPTVLATVAPTTIATATVATVATAATSPATSAPEPTSTLAATSSAVEPPTTPLPTTTVPAEPSPRSTPESTVPATASTTAVTAAPVPQCSDAGAISIASIKVLQPILAEATPFDDGLLCGNHARDGVDQGVDILPGFASVDASAEGGAALVGRVPAVIFGHRKSHNHPFLRIDKLQTSDIVVIHRLDGTEVDMKVATVELHSLADATSLLFAPSPDGAARVRLVACSHADGTPGGVNFRWIATLVPA
ncbi:MAG: hypothetical protein JWN62_3776 [Acidimicrobiales bacterium]|nr:hypothetical protein [Acidimicrobiales bacterium]